MCYIALVAHTHADRDRDMAQLSILAFTKRKSASAHDGSLKTPEEMREENKALLESLCALNRDGTLTRDPKTHIFRDERQEGVLKRRGGITRLLKRECYSNFKEVERAHHRRSGRDVGERFHRHMFHHYMCAPLQKEARRVAQKERERVMNEFEKRRGRPMKRKPRLHYEKVCLCESEFGKRTHDTRLKDDSSMRRWVSAAVKRLKALGIRPVVCEPIISCREFTTQADLLGLADDGQSVVNVSWKTGYSSRTLHRARTTDDTGRMRGEASHITNSEQMQHALQQSLENEIMRVGHNIPVMRSLVLYVGCDPKSPDTVFEVETKPGAILTKPLLQHLQLAALPKHRKFLN